MIHTALWDISPLWTCEESAVHALLYLPVNHRDEPHTLMHRSNYWWRQSGTAQRSCFLSQMSNIFGARLNHTTVNKTHLTVQLLSSSVLLLHVRNKFTGTLQWLLHWRPASRKHASCCQDRLMRNQCTHEQITAVYMLFCLLVSISSQRRFDQCSKSEHVSQTCVHHSELKPREKQACVKLVQVQFSNSL